MCYCTNRVPGLSKHAHILRHQAPCSGCFDYHHFTRDARSTTGHSEEGCWVCSPAQRKPDTQGSYGHFLGLLLTPNGPLPTCVPALILTFGSPSLQLALSSLYSATEEPGSTPLSCCFGWPWRHAGLRCPWTQGGGRRTRQKQLRPVVPGSHGRCSGCPGLGHTHPLHCGPITAWI